MATSLGTIQAAVPGILIWLPRVFSVLGGFMFTSGLLTCYIVISSFRRRERGAAAVAALTGLSSIGLMCVVNLIILYDSKWPLLPFTTHWVVALALNWTARKIH